MFDGSIKNTQVSAWSYYHYDEVELQPWKARLYNSEHWAPESSYPSAPWIQVDFLSSFILTGIRVQGSGIRGYNYWIKSLQIQTGDSETSLSYIMDGSQRMVCIIIKTWKSKCSLFFTLVVLNLLIIIKMYKNDHILFYFILFYFLKKSLCIYKGSFLRIVKITFK